MPIVKILESFEAAEGYQVGDVVDMTNPDALIREGKVKLFVADAKKEVVDAENIGADTDKPKKRTRSRKKVAR